MKLKIDEEKCLGCGQCAAIAPEFFQLDPEKGKAKVIKQPKEEIEAVREAINNCPVGAISRDEEGKKEQK